MASTTSSSTHVVLFPFMAKGHTIPILQLARVLHRRNTIVTLFTTPSNHPFITTSLSDTTTSIMALPFSHGGVESTDQLPSMSHFLPFVKSTKLIQPYFEQALKSLEPPVTFMVTDGFMGWTLESANKLNIPRLFYYGMGNFALTISVVISQNPNLFQDKSDNDLVVVPGFPWIKTTRIELLVDDKGDLDTPYEEWMTEQILANIKSYGMVTNSFYELEPVYTDYWNKNVGPKSWSVGPFCLSQELMINDKEREKPSWIVWLDEKLQNGCTVLYVAFGSQAEMSLDQIEEIKLGLEKSRVNFLWVMTTLQQTSLCARIKNEVGFDDGFEERVKEKGIVVREWVNQMEILKHESVKGFLSHCGWNSVLESICAAVPILAWPLMAEQPLNAKFVVEEIKIGMKVETCDGSVKGFVKHGELETKVRELMESEKGEEMRKTVKEFQAAALKAVEDGGSSWHTLNKLLDEIQAKSTIA